MKVKYKLSLTWIILAILFIVLTVFLYSKYSYLTDANNLQIFLLLPALISIYYFLMPTINYIRIKDDELFLHKSFVIFTHKIKLSDIHHCKLMRKDLVIFTNNEDVYPIHLDWSKKEPMIAFVKFLSERCRMEDQDENSFRLEKLKDIL